MRKLAIEHTFKSYRTFDTRPGDVPANWLIFEAPRPILGDKNWRGSNGSGWHYAAIDPTDAYMLPIHLSNLKKNAARLVKYVTEADYQEWLKTYFEDPQELNHVLSDSDLLDIYKDNFIQDGEDKEIVL
ncbi:MAG: hypothetical protein WC511_02655 [Candidatus Pacearchaeota archaeon]